MRAPVGRWNGHPECVSEPDAGIFVALRDGGGYLHLPRSREREKKAARCNLGSDHLARSRTLSAL
jgi:hypothetical protein